MSIFSNEILPQKRSGFFSILTLTNFAINILSVYTNINIKVLPRLTMLNFGLLAIITLDQQTAQYETFEVDK